MDRFFWNKGGEMSYTSCSFTGHRRIEERHAPKLPALLSRAIKYAYENGVRCFFCGGAYGFDTLAAREVIRFRAHHPDVRLVLLLPCPEQASGWSARLRDAYEYVLSVSDEVVYMSETYTRGCMQKRNRELVERAELVIAYLSHAHSGSAQTVNYANRAGKTVYNLYPALENGAE